MTPEDIFDFRSDYEFHAYYEESNERLGSGGFGVVYRGTRKTDRQEIAIKHVPLNTICWMWRTPAQDTSIIPQELELLYRAQVCPGVIRLFDSWRDDSHLVLVMEYNKNATDLQEHINVNGVNGTLEETEAAHILRQIIRTLLACQEQNIFHRDVKLENILYDKTTKQTTLIDFGCGELTTSPNQIFRKYIGTVEYIPPEYFVHNTYSAESATVWSIGCIAFTMIFGRSPFNNEEDIIRHRFKMEHGVGSLDARLFIRKCLTPVPEDRAKLADLLSTKFLLENPPVINEDPTEPEEEQPILMNRRAYETERDFSECSRHQFFRSQRQPSRKAPTNTGSQTEVQHQQVRREVDCSFRDMRNFRRPPPQTTEPPRWRRCELLKRISSAFNCCRAK